MHKQLCINCFSTKADTAKFSEERAKMQAAMMEKGIFWCPIILKERFLAKLNSLLPKDRNLYEYLASTLTMELSADKKCVPTYCPYRNAHFLFHDEPFTSNE